jgi:hypothetical protein
MKSGTPSGLPRRPALPCAVAILLLGTLAAVSACETEAQRIEHQDRSLVADGFQPKPADTPERQTMLSRLPVNHFVQRVDGGRSLYIYSDPTVCKCIYVGTQHNYDNYKADRQSVVILPYEGAAADWTVWGPWPAEN